MCGQKYAPKSWQTENSFLIKTNGQKNKKTKTEQLIEIVQAENEAKGHCNKIEREKRRKKSQWRHNSHMVMGCQGGKRGGGGGGEEKKKRKKEEKQNKNINTQTNKRKQ